MKINQSNSRNKGEEVIILLICVVFLFLAFLWGMALSSALDKDKAISAGVAHYTVNSQTGETKFEWITNSAK